MSYFNHAFKKSFLVTNSSNTPLISGLEAGHVGVYNKEFVSFIGQGQEPFTIAVGSHHLEAGATVTTTAKDKIGNNPGHGGYTESVKTKGINPRYMTALRVVECDEGALPSATISVGSHCAPCGENLFLRIDIKGSPALRFLNHNAYAIGDSSGDAANGALPGLCCVDGQDFLDPAVALAAAAQMVLSDPLISPFVKEPTAGGMSVTVGAATSQFTIAEVLDGTYTPSTDPVADEVTAQLLLEGAYVDTKFGNCSFDTRDHYEKEPVTIILSLLDETGDPCNDCGVATSTPGRMATTSGETVLRELLMTESYMQMPYNQRTADSSRIREIELSDDIVGAIDRTALYKLYQLQHSVPRFNNPTGVFDNDQYVYNFYVKCDDENGDEAINEVFNQLRELANEYYGNPIQVDTLVCGGKGKAFLGEEFK